MSLTLAAKGRLIDPVQVEMCWPLMVARRVLQRVDGELRGLFERVWHMHMEHADHRPRYGIVSRLQQIATCLGWTWTAPCTLEAKRTKYVSGGPGADMVDECAQAGHPEPHLEDGQAARGRTYFAAVEEGVAYDPTVALLRKAETMKRTSTLAEDTRTDYEETVDLEKMKVASEDAPYLRALLTRSILVGVRGAGGPSPECPPHSMGDRCGTHEEAAGDLRGHDEEAAAVPPTLGARGKGGEVHDRAGGADGSGLGVGVNSGHARVAGRNRGHVGWGRAG